MISGAEFVYLSANLELGLLAICEIKWLHFIKIGLSMSEMSNFSKCTKKNNFLKGPGGHHQIISFIFLNLPKCKVLNRSTGEANSK